jgi:hypothetical protein
MKKIYCILAIACIAVLFSTPIMAAQTIEWDADEAVRVIKDDTGGGSGLTKISLSPNVNLYYASNADGTKFEIGGYNEKGKFEYGVTADNNNVYMHDMDSADTGTITPVSDTVVGDGTVVTAAPWILMGGGAAAAK